MDILYDILSLARGRHCSVFGGVYAVWAHVIILITNVIIVYRHHHEWHCRVQVNVANLSRDLGYIEYEARESGLLTEEEIIIIGVCVGAACLIILVIVIAVVVQLKRKSTEKDRENRRLLALLFQLESSVRDQCKQGLYSSQSVSSAPLCLSFNLTFSDCSVLTRTVYIKPVCLPVSVTSLQWSGQPLCLYWLYLSRRRSR